jgi:hypothetical protein
MTKNGGKGNSLAKILSLRRHGTILPLSPLILMYRPSGFPQSIEFQGNSSTVRSVRADRVDSQICLLLAVTLSPLTFPRKILEVDHRKIRKTVLRTRLHLLSCRPRLHLLCIQIVHFFLDIRRWLALVAGSVLGLRKFMQYNSCTSRT